MEKIWCVYRYFLGPEDFGKIVKENEGRVYVQYSENQQSPEPWDPKWVKRFSTLKEAIDYFIENGGLEKYRTEKKIRAVAKVRFPSEFK